MTPQMRKNMMKFEQLREEFKFMRENDISTADDMTAFQSKTEESLKELIKRRTILNVQKKKRRKIYKALTDVESLAEARKLYEDGVSGMEGEAARYAEAVSVLENSGVNQIELAQEKSELYKKLAEINREIRVKRKQLKMCGTIMARTPEMERDVRRIESIKKPSKKDKKITQMR